MSYSISRVRWEQAAPLLKDVREKVFICEWRIPKHIEFDRKDRFAFHVLVCDDKTQEPIATGRILATGEISRIAVLLPYRKKQVDGIVMQGLLSIAQELRLDEVFIYSPLDTVEYYRRFNFNSAGAVFMEAGMPRQRLGCQLDDIQHANYCYTH